jgi:two-component system cell cycle sensor histidine kinase/response regulator CckA
VSVTSITARLPRVEDRLLLHRQMIESLPFALLVCDAATLTIVEHNAAASVFFGQVRASSHPRSLVGHDASDFFPDFAETLKPLLRRAVDTQEACCADELRLPAPGGGERFVAVTVQPMAVDDFVMYLMVSVLEVTQQVAARERQKHFDRMESVGTLAGGLAHDVNNMLFAIGGHSYLLRARTEMMPEALEELDQIDAAIARARTLTSKLLTFARGGCPERGPVQLNETVTETLRMLSGSLGTEVSLELSLDPDLPLILADTGGLQQILVNFCVNARDAMEGRGRLGIRTARENGSVLLEVRDSGPGIPDTVRSRIFEPFFTTKRERGTGLGLSVVYGLVKNYGGSVHAANAHDGGARFTVRLPAMEEGV